VRVFPGFVSVPRPRLRGRGRSIRFFHPMFFTIFSSCSALSALSVPSADLRSQWYHPVLVVLLRLLRLRHPCLMLVFSTSIKMAGPVADQLAFFFLNATLVPWHLSAGIGTFANIPELGLPPGRFHPGWFYSVFGYSPFGLSPWETASAWVAAPPGWEIVGYAHAMTCPQSACSD